MTQKNLKASSLLGAIVAFLIGLGLINGPKPTPIPTPTPTASPEPTPTASPEPTLTPLPTPAPDPCIYPPSDGACVFDPDGEGEFQADVAEAQAKAKADGYLTPDGRVKDERLYTNAVAKNLKQAGVCAVNGSAVSHTSEDETWTRGPNHSEHYDIIRSDGVPILLYAARCSPAKF